MRITYGKLDEDDWLCHLNHILNGVETSTKWCGVCHWYSKCDPLARNRLLCKSLRDAYVVDSKAVIVEKMS
jgi:hypothetical protein